MRADDRATWDLVENIDRYWSRGGQILTDPLDDFLADVLLRMDDMCLAGTPLIIDLVPTFLTEGIEFTAVGLLLAQWRALRDGTTLRALLQMDRVRAFTLVLGHIDPVLFSRVLVPEVAPSDARTRGYEMISHKLGFDADADWPPVKNFDDTRMIGQIHPAYMHQVRLSERGGAEDLRPSRDLPAEVALLALASEPSPDPMHHQFHCPCVGKSQRGWITGPALREWIHDALLPVLLAAYSGVNPGVVAQMLAELELERW